MSTCAACGKGGDGLKACTGCDQVKYCNGACRKAHWQKHKKQCRQQQVDTMRIISECTKKFDSIVISDNELFKDPPPKEECPICLLPMPHASGACGVYKGYQPCCGKRICVGCMHGAKDEMNKGNIKGCCPFCRKPIGGSGEEYLERCKKRMMANDIYAINMLGETYGNGFHGTPQNYIKALEFWFQAAKLGSLDAHNSIANAYFNGDGIDKDKEKAIHHWEIAAIGGHEPARHNLAIYEGYKGQHERAMKHFMIAAKSGYDSLKEVGEGYKRGDVSKDEYAMTLRAYKDSMDEMKSDHRTKAEAAMAHRVL